MAEIDPRLNAIIETALGSPLAPLIVRALARIEALETQPRRIDEDPAYPPGLFQRSSLSRRQVLFFKPEVATVIGFAVNS